MTLRSWLRNPTRTLIVGAVALVVVVPTFTLIPVATAQVPEPVVAVDVDLVEGGVWVTWSNGCIDSRAWRQPLNNERGFFRASIGHGCAPKGSRFPANYPFYHSRPIRAPEVLADGERVVALVPTEGDEGYWLVTSTGRLVTGGAAEHLGDLSAHVLNAPVVAVAPTESGNGYYMLTEDGGVFSFGDAVFYGSVQGLVDKHVGLGELAVDHITAPVVTLATTPAGYWLVAADGTVFPFGDAVYHGSVQDSINMGNQLSGVTRDWVLTPVVVPGGSLARDALSAPVIGVVPSDGGTGYQMVAADGGIFNFGVSQFHGSLAGRALSPAVASDVTESRSGYVILTEEGRVHRFGVMDGQWDEVGRAPTALTQTALPAQECRPPGQQGFPLPWTAALPTGPHDVGVLLVEFDDYRADRELWPLDAIMDELYSAERYLEAASYGTTDIRFTVTDGWISVGSMRDDFLVDWRSSNIVHRLSAGQILDHVVDHAAEKFDFSNEGMGYDSYVIVFPPSLFRGGTAYRWIGTKAGDITIDTVAMVNSFGPYPNRNQSADSWWYVAAHELMHLPGLPDLYAYRAGVKQRPEGWTLRGWLTSEFGLMGWQRDWPLERLPVVGEISPNVGEGLITLADGRSFLGTYYLERVQEALEMLAWHRWRMGWLRADQIVCLAVGDAEVDLMPIARPDGGVATAFVKLSTTEVLVLEHRKRIGYDADQPTRWQRYDRVLSSEGVLAYVVDVSIYGGSLPVEMFGWAETNLQPGEDWILSPGEWRTQELPDGTTLRLDVSEGFDDTMRVNISTGS